MNAERLLILADALERPETFSDIRFDFGDLAAGTCASSNALSCGSTACAIGLMPMIPEFTALGVRYAYSATSDVVDVNDWIDVVTDKTSNAFATAELVFGLTEKEASYLFSPGYSTVVNGESKWHGSHVGAASTATEVAIHIRAFVARGGMPESAP